MDATPSSRTLDPTPPPLPASLPPSRRRLFRVLGGFVVLLLVGRLAGPAVAGFLRSHNQILPPCLMHKMTGLHCPGCGSTRAVLALLEGDWVRAARNNILFACAFPFLAWWAAMRLLGRPMRRPQPWFPIVLAVIVVAYWILRNVPSFSWLAPVD